MPEIRKYYIPELGEFGINYLDEKMSREGVAESGYYGTRGTKRITERFETIGETERALVRIIHREVYEKFKTFLREIRERECKLNLLIRLISEIDSADQSISRFGVKPGILKLDDIGIPG